MAAAAHWPEPLHSEVVSVELMHDVRQGVPAAYSAHAAPLPLHAPFVPHEALPWSPHSLSGSLPAAMGPQTPSTPVLRFAAVHATQTPAHAWSQQTPSAQLPDWHCVAELQASPDTPSGWQLPSVVRQ